MRTIWKFELKITDHQTIEIPAGSKVLSAGFQGDTLCIWALVNPQASKVGRSFRIVGTGHPFDDEHAWKFVATVSHHGLVFHIFE